LLAALAVAMPLSSWPGGAVQATPVEDVIRVALAEYPTIVAARADTEAARIRIVEARARHLPVLEAAAAARVRGQPPSGPLPRLRFNLYAGGSIEALVERETLTARSLASREAQVREEVAFAAAQAYLRLLRGLRVALARERSVERHRKLADDFAEIARLDPGRRFDLVQARSRLSLATGQLDDAVAEVAAARQGLARFYPYPVDEAAMRVPELPAPPDAPGAVDAHPSVRAARSVLDSAEVNARVQRLQRGPRVDFEAIGGREPLSRIVLSWPVFDRTLTAAEQSAASALVGAEATLRETELEVTEVLRQASVDHVAAMRRLDQARGQAVLGDELVDIYFAQFQVGRRNLLDLLTAFAELATAEVRVASAEVDVALSRFRHAFASGTLAASHPDAGAQ
jgi:outer membrane protein, adhesin transport system